MGAREPVPVTNALEDDVVGDGVGPNAELGASRSMSCAASTRSLQRECRTAWNVALEWEQKAGMAQKTRSVTSER